MQLLEGRDPPELASSTSHLSCLPILEAVGCQALSQKGCHREFSQNPGKPSDPGCPEQESVLTVDAGCVAL